MLQWALWKPRPEHKITSSDRKVKTPRCKYLEHYQAHFIRLRNWHILFARSAFTQLLWSTCWGPSSHEPHSTEHNGLVDCFGPHGVATVMNGRTHGALTSWEPISSRIAREWFRNTAFNMAVTVIYAKTLNNDSVTETSSTKMSCQFQGFGAPARGRWVHPTQIKLTIHVPLGVKQVLAEYWSTNNRPFSIY